MFDDSLPDNVLQNFRNRNLTLFRGFSKTSASKNRQQLKLLITPEKNIYFTNSSSIHQKCNSPLRNSLSALRPACQSG